jgi:hypothetical protein
MKPWVDSLAGCCPLAVNQCTGNFAAMQYRYSSFGLRSGRPELFSWNLRAAFHNMPDNREYLEEDVLTHAREAFSQTVALKVQQLYRYVPRGSNPTLTGQFVEELVRGFVQKWLGHRRLLSGMFYSTEFAKSGRTPLQIDGIVYDPHSGPVILEEGGFVVVHPAFCTNVIEIKTSIASLNDFQERLQRTYHTYMHHTTTPHVMGIVISDADPETKSLRTPHGRDYPAYHYQLAGWCPIFILFAESAGEYRPHVPAIDAMIRCIYANRYRFVNYFS